MVVGRANWEWEIWLTKGTERCSEPEVFLVASTLSATDLELTCSDTFIEHFPCAWCLAQGIIRSLQPEEAKGILCPFFPLVRFREVR